MRKPRRPSPPPAVPPHRDADAGSPGSGPHRILPATRSWPLFDVVGTRAIEARARQALPPGTLMRRAGLSVARLALALWPHARSVWVAAGPGGNGGDALHAAAHLATAGRRVGVGLVAHDRALQPDAAEGLQRALQAGVQVGTDGPPDGCELVIDGLLGLGGSRPPTGAIAARISQLRAARVPCLAIDLPSGLSADTGAVLGDSVVQADACLSLLTLKPGLFTASGRACAGEIWFDDLQVDPLAADEPCALLAGADDWQAAWPARRHDAHKGSFGDVVVIGGGAGMAGAVRLAAHAALAAGAGRTIVSPLDPQASLADEGRPECLWTREAWHWEARRLAACTVVCGCGGGDAVAAALPPLLAHAAALVLDADGLNAVAREPALQTLLSDRASRGLATVLTPHPLEAARLLGADTAQVQADRLAAARDLAGRFHAVVVLKGSGTIVAAPASTCTVNGTGSAALASGGTGDVLAGWIGGLWSARRSSLHGPLPVWDLARRCAIAAVWRHGQAADRCGLPSVRALDLIDAMRQPLEAAGPQP